MVLVGVARTGGRFPELRAVPGAVAAVRDWALAQGVPADLLLTYTDADGGAVDAGAVLAGVRGLLDRGDVEQLVLYFSGHGINTGSSEFWLLPGAPEDGGQAVNVSLTAWYAERLPVRHVVLVSDACRTAATSTQELAIQGTAVVPNLPPRGPAAAVDVFYACALGDPAYELTDPAAAGEAYRAVFTSALVAALRGDHPALVGGEDGAASGAGLVRPWPLKRALPGLVAAELTAAGAPLAVAQTPDARLSSDPDVAWLSRLVPWPPAGTDGHESLAAPGAVPPPDPGPAPLPAEVTTAADRLAVGLALAGPGPAASVRVLGDPAAQVLPGTDGAAVVALSAGGCAVLPLLPGRVTVATVEDGRLVDCALPRADAPRATAALGRRALAAASSRFGLDADDTDDDADADLDADPLAAVYRAWALHDRGRRADLAALAAPGAPGARLFDVLLLADPAAPPDRWRALLTPVPLLARGWALLPAAPDAVRARAAAFGPRLPGHWTVVAADAPRVAAALRAPEEAP
ncbi:hypothetical protein CHO01_38940 [Cellulomonas hominis]|nr:hypothetical protein CHO01_38940 [Cellulomonas hominis]